MKKLHKIIIFTLILGITLVTIGLIGGLKFDMVVDFFNEDEKYGDQLSYESIGIIDSLTVDVETRNIDIEYVETDVLTIYYYAHEDDTWLVNEEDGHITITQDHKNIFQFFTVFKYASREVRTMTIYLPLSLSETLDIKTNVGDINLELYQDYHIATTRLRTDTGDIDVNGGTYDSFTVNSSTGNVLMKYVDVETLISRNDTGNLVIEDSSFLSVSSYQSTGDTTIRRSVVIEEMSLEASTGDLKIYDSEAASYDLETQTGNILYNYSMVLVDHDFRFDLIVSVGNIKINQVSQGNRHITSTGTILMKARNSTGNITINYYTQ